MDITAISDLHGHYPDLPGGDLLIVAGDLTASDTKLEMKRFTDWYLSQDYRKKVFVAGNHDGCIEDGRYYFNHDWLGYLQDSSTEFEGLKIYGSPWTLEFEGMNPSCKAFTCKTEEELFKHFSKIPNNIDILVTHSPAKGMLDVTVRGENVGSSALCQNIMRAQVTTHIFGHIHESYGMEN